MHHRELQVMAGAQTAMATHPWTFVTSAVHAMSLGPGAWHARGATGLGADAGAGPVPTAL